MLTSVNRPSVRARGAGDESPLMGQDPPTDGRTQRSGGARPHVAWIRRSTGTSPGRRPQSARRPRRASPTCRAPGRSAGDRSGLTPSCRSSASVDRAWAAPSAVPWSAPSATPSSPRPRRWPGATSASGPPSSSTSCTGRSPGSLWRPAGCRRLSASSPPSSSSSTRSRPTSTARSWATSTSAGPSGPRGPRGSRTSPRRWRSRPSVPWSP